MIFVLCLLLSVTMMALVYSIFGWKMSANDHRATLMLWQGSIEDNKRLRGLIMELTKQFETGEPNCGCCLYRIKEVLSND